MTAFQRLGLIGLMYCTLILFELGGAAESLHAEQSSTGTPDQIWASEHPSSATRPSQEQSTTQGDVQAEFFSIVEKYVADRGATNGGTFTIQDDVLAKEWRLRLVLIHKDKIVRLAANRYFACADFAEVKGQAHLDLDFYAAVDPSPVVTDVLIHKVDGSPRFTYDSSGARMPVVGLENSDSPASKSGRVLEVGDQAPDFSLRSLTGENIALSAHKKESVVLWFTNLCGGCQAVLPDVEKINRDYSGKGVSVLAISLLGDDTVAVKNVVLKQKSTFPFLIDPEGEVYEQYGGVKLPPDACPTNPQLFILDKGRVAYATHFPGASRDELRSVLDHLIGSSKPEAPSEHPSEHPGGSSGH